MRNAGLDEAQAGIKIAGRNINNLRYADNTTSCCTPETNTMLQINCSPVWNKKLEDRK